MARASLELTSRIPAFFDLLGQQDTSIPIQSQWVLVFDHFPTDVITDVKVLEAFSSSQGALSWDIQNAFSKAIANPLQTTKGCIFAQAVNLPPDGFENARVGEFYGGYVKGLISTTRKEFGTFSASFLETNLSFADAVLRPWSIVVAHKSLIARDAAMQSVTSAGPNKALKTRITVMQLGKAGWGVTPVIRKQFNFYDCVPCSIDSEEYSYEGEKVVQRQVEFLYTYYTLQSMNTNASTSNATPLPPLYQQGDPISIGVIPVVR